MKSRRENKGAGQGRLIIPTLLLLMVAAPIIYFLGCHSASNSDRASYGSRSYALKSAPASKERIELKDAQEASKSSRDLEFAMRTYKAAQYALPPKKHHQHNLLHSVQPLFNQQLLQVDPNAAAHQAELDLQEGHNTETYDRIDENKFHSAVKDPLSTFSIDVDTASYSNVRRFLNGGQLPPRGAVRVEELINYFTYNYSQPEADKPFSVTTEVAGCPWDPKHQLVHIGIQGRKISNENVPSRNLVFLLDVSGSMQSAHKLPLLKSAISLLVENLREEDSVAIVVYAGASGLVLPSTSGALRERIHSAIDRLSAGGSTNGGAGIQLAYQVAQENFIKDGINRVILATDGDFNVGTTSQSELTRLIEKKRESGVFLTVLGFGMGNYKDSTMEKLADKGNGNYAYIDSLREAQKVLVKEAGATLVTIAKDVKIQVEFNPAQVQAYRLVGYENRMLQAQDFNDDKKDAGEIGAGHSVTAIYEIIPPGVEWDQPGIDELKYQKSPKANPETPGDELLTLKLRYKQPDGDKSSKLVFPVKKSNAFFSDASENFRFSAAVAAFGMMLRDSSRGGTLTLEGVQEIAQTSCGEDTEDYRKEFLRLVQIVRKLKGARK